MKDNNFIPKVSVIMPAYNAEKYIEEAIKSVLNQTMSDLELIIIDDCSKDHTMKIIGKIAQDDSRICVKKNEINSGVAKTRNLGLTLSKGKYVAFIDSDDIWHNDKLEKQLVLAEQSQADIIYSTYSLINEQGTKMYNEFVVPAKVDFGQMLKCNFIGCSTVMMKREVTENYKFDTSFFHEDYVLWLQLLKEGYKAVGVVESLVDYRVIQTSKSANKLKSAKHRWEIYRKSVGLSFVKSAICSAKYAVGGIRKFRKIHR